MDDRTELQTGEVSQDDRNMGMLCHLISLSGLVIPFGNFLGPLIVWLIKKDQSPFVDDQGKEAINFNITVAIAGVVSVILFAVLIGFLLIVIVFLGWLILTIRGAIKASKGEAYRYPFTLRLLK